MSNTANRVGSGPKKCAKIPCNILLLVFTLVLSCLVDWMIALSHSNKEKTTHIGHFYTLFIKGGSVMVWGGISLTGKTEFVIIEGNLNAVRYRNEILEPVGIPYLQNLGPNSILQDDNARPHRARIFTEYLQNLGVERMEWPAVSPDLNPIEYFWDQLGRAVRIRVTNATMLADLRQILVAEWDAIPQQCVTRLVTSMRRRCQAVVAA